jgi:hypothetical protein
MPIVETPTALLRSWCVGQSATSWTAIEDNSIPMVPQDPFTHSESKCVDPLTHQRKRFGIVRSQILEGFWRVPVLDLGFSEK